MNARNRFQLLIVCACMAVSVMAQVERPKLVVGVMVDQMRWDYLYYYGDRYGEKGVKRLLDDGFSCENTMIPYVPTVTAIGHASVYTGTTPAQHGICGNNFFIENKDVYCCGDSTVKSVGSDTKRGKMSPHYMLASTIGDELKIATDYRSKVIGIAIKDRAAILPAGHSADAAYWWDKDAGCFVTSTFYMNELPSWVTKFNKKHHGDIKGDPIMKPEGVTLTFDMAIAALDNERLGQRGETDMLAISISSTDGIGHQYGTHTPETDAAYLQFDKDLARFLNVLDAKVGKGQYLLFLTADHGAAHNYNTLLKHRIPAGGWESWETAKQLRQYLKTLHPEADNLVTGENSYRFYLHHENIEKAGLSLQQVKEEAMEWLRKDNRIQFVIDFADAANATVPPIIRDRLCYGYNPDRAGDIAVITKPQVFATTDKPDYRGTSHGAWNPYDAHIPCVFFGWKVPKGSTNKATYMTDIAPTVCAMLHIQMPNACMGSAITEISDN